MFFILFWAILTRSVWTDSYGSSGPFSFPPCDPESELLFFESLAAPPPWLCTVWNPDFTFNGNQCCGRPPLRGRKRRLNRCSPQRIKNGYCSEMTAEQRKYIAMAQGSSHLIESKPDLLDLIIQEKGKKGQQSYCSVNNGFLVQGRPILPTSQNRVFIKSPERCLNFGTDSMVGMLEWLGRELYKGYPPQPQAEPHLVIGDISGPRGGCLFGRSGRRGHASHTSGVDADIGFVAPIPAGQAPGAVFIRTFHPAMNWWFLKKVFTNPFACIKAIFLDRRHIKALGKVAKKDPDWALFHRFIRHMPGHKNHFHIRIGNGPGAPGCGPGAQPELEDEDDGDSMDEDEAFMDELKSRASLGVGRKNK